MMDEIHFDRTSKNLTVPDNRSYFQVRALQASHRILAPIGFIGISRIHALISRIVKPTTMTVVKEKDFEFRFPSTDYYWNRLLDASWTYEPEIDMFLRHVAETPFIFLDLGANFGYWTARVGAGLYGQHRVVAVEASEHCLSVLRRNAQNKPVSVHHRAIDDTSGKIVKLYGDRHAGFSIDNSWYGASRNEANSVQSITIDDLLVEEKVDFDNEPIIIKLDVEGVELRALAGATRAMSGIAAFIIEDADREGLSDAVRYAKDTLGMTIFVIENGRIVELPTLADLERIKRHQSRVQATGLNLIATNSPFWEEKMRSGATASSR